MVRKGDDLSTGHTITSITQLNTFSQGSVYVEYIGHQE